MNKLLSNLDKIKSTIFHDYLYDLCSSYTPLPYNIFESIENASGEKTIRVADSNIALFKVDSCVFDKKEQLYETFGNIYNAFANRKETIAYIINRTAKETTLYFAIKTDLLSGGNELTTQNGYSLLKKAIEGNFPGTNIVDDENLEKSKVYYVDYKKLCDNSKAVSVLMGIPSDKSEKRISQGIERVINGCIPKGDADSYTIVFIAEPISHDNLIDIKTGYEELASSIYSYSERQLTFSESTSENEGYSDSDAFSLGTNKSISKTNGFNVGLNGSINTGATETTGRGWLAGLVHPIKMVSNATNIVGSVGASVGYQHSRTETEGTSETTTSTQSTNYGITIGKTEGENINEKSYPVYELIQRIEKQLERIDEFEAVGAWKYGVYVLGQNTTTTTNTANYIQSIIQGKDSYVDSSVINTYPNQYVKKMDDIRDYVMRFTHPLFVNNSDINILGNTEITISELFDKALIVTPTTYVSSLELAKTMIFPYTSVQGVSCSECAPFERNIVLKDKRYWDEDQAKKYCPTTLGKIYHMLNTEETPVDLDINELTKHTFVTGSTGSGKTTAIIGLLKSILLKKKDLNYFIVEPTKGEYAKYLGDEATVYSTNSYKGKPLRLNPFYFPYKSGSGVLVSEHIDRLVELFNVCWPMYAAMPALLKDAIERAYEEAGWDLITSNNDISEDLFPTFSDVLDQLVEIIEKTSYSADTKGDYTGALVTRVKSLTNGIMGQVFGADGLSDSDLFDHKVILDLSRVGSSETKSMIMAMAVMRLQEYHMANDTPDNTGLKHLVVLEEAHHLLKKTSTEQSSESANLQGKAVEMITNAIAEMRTYGEGFIIADQSPMLLDEAIIRNTNTKIMLSLPDYSDRELVGKSMGLNDEQIIEVAKLPQGKAVVYQNNWVSAVLCDINKFDCDNEGSKEDGQDNNSNAWNSIICDQNLTKGSIVELVMDDKMDELAAARNRIIFSNISARAKKKLIKQAESKRPFNKDEKMLAIYDLYQSDKIERLFASTEVLPISDDTQQAKDIYSQWCKALGVEELNARISAFVINVLLQLRQKIDQDVSSENCEKIYSQVYEANRDMVVNGII